MQRRHAIKIMTGSSIFLLTGLGACSSNFDQRVVQSYDASDDIRLHLLRYAMLAPNPHNIQPWLIKLIGQDKIELYVDKERLLPETDPIYRQIHIGQGTFLEGLSIAASQFGYKANIAYFPRGEYSNVELMNLPVASVQLIADTKIQPDPLFAAMLKRQSNKRNYDNSLLSQDEIKLLEQEVTDENIKLDVFQSKQDKKSFSELLTRAMEIEVKDIQREMETINLFRFNQKEMDKYRDGFGIGQNGSAGIKKWAIEQFIISRQDAISNPASFSDAAVKLTSDGVKSSHGFAVLSSKENSRVEQLRVGRAYIRLNLKTQALGIAQHPMSQILQEYPDMHSLQQQFKRQYKYSEDETVQMIFRLGRAAAVEFSPRRKIKDIVV